MTLTETSTAVAELIEAMNARMLDYEFRLTGKPSEGFEDEAYNGLLEVELVLRDEIAATWSSVEAYHEYSDGPHHDTPFLSCDQERETDEAMFWSDYVIDQSRFVALMYVLDPSKTEAMLAHVTQPKFKVYSDDWRAQNLADIKAGI